MALTAQEISERHNASLTPKAGHNSDNELRSLIERVERLEEQKKSYADDIRDIYAEAKGRGFDAKALRTIVKMRKQDADKRREEQEILDTYLNALGMLL